MPCTLIPEAARADSALDQVRLAAWETDGGKVLASCAPLALTAVVAETAAST